MRKVARVSRTGYVPVMLTPELDTPEPRPDFVTSLKLKRSTLTRIQELAAEEHGKVSIDWVLNRLLDIAAKKKDWKKG